MDEFHQHLISINPSIQFTLELDNTTRHGLRFLDTITTRRGTQFEVNVYRKPTHTDRYLDFHSHDPMCHKKSVVSTLLRKAQNIPSTQKGKSRRNKTSQGCTACETIIIPLPSSIAAKDRCRNSTLIYNKMPGFVVLCCVQSISERISRIFWQQRSKSSSDH